MLVSHRHSFIYTKTRKTGGTSVESYFERFCMPEGEWRRTHGRDEYISAAGIIGHRGLGVRRSDDCRYWHHMPAALIRERVGRDVWNRYFKFCVVRNPYDKVVSAFYFVRRRTEATDWCGLDAERRGFERFVRDRIESMVDRDKYVIDGVLCMDAIVRYEALSQDLEQVCARLGIPWNPAELPTYKTGIRPEEARTDVIYTRKTKKLVEKAFAFEMKHFGYSFPQGS